MGTIPRVGRPSGKKNSYVTHEANIVAGSGTLEIRISLGAGIGADAERDEEGVRRILPR